MPESVPERLTVTVARTWFAVRTALGRPDGLAVFGLVAAAYLLGYLVAIGHLLPGATGLGVAVADEPLARLFRQSLGAFSFEPVARVDLLIATYLLSLNSALGAGLAALVGTNLAVTYLAWRQPAACGLGASSAGALAGLPAMLSGAACCGPLVLIVLGVQATGALLTAFEFLLPGAAVLLVGSLLLVGRQVDPAAVAGAGAA